MAHPEDEIIFLGPWLEGDCSDLTILGCTSDFNYPDREWGTYRKVALGQIAKIKGAEVECLDYTSSLFEKHGKRRIDDQGDERTPYRSAIDEISNRITIRGSGCEYVATQHPMGEYGHLGHKVIFDTVRKRSVAENGRIPL